MIGLYIASLVVKTSKKESLFFIYRILQPCERESTQNTQKEGGTLHAMKSKPEAEQEANIFA